MTVLEITSLRLEGIVDNYLEARAHTGGAPGHKHQNVTGPGAAGYSEELLKAEKGEMPDEFYIDNIQKTLTIQFPWDMLDIPKPSVVRDGKMNPSTKAGLQKIKQVATELKNQTALNALKKIEAGDLHRGASELWTSALQIMRTMKTDKKYFKETGEEPGWDYQKKVQYMSTTLYPVYFPKPWQARNMCSFVGGGDKHGKFTKMPGTEAEFRTCQTPQFNNFLMWGPECPDCGVGGADPRYLRVKSKYPQAFTLMKNKHRRVNHIWSPTVPSPGFKPYVAAPPEGSPYYADPNDPKPETEGVRFFDAEDEKMYREYMAKFLQFKEQFGAEAEEYNKKFFAMLPHKKTKSRWKAPNEWSAGQYGRKKPLWPDGTARPPAAELAKRIQEEGVGTGPDVITSASVQELAERFKKTY